MSAPLLAAKLIELRHQHGYSQQEVADYLDLTREGYSHYERNVREPNLETLLKLCQLYHISISDLVNENTVLSFDTVPTNLPLSKNLHHFYKLLTGKNASVDFTNVTKEDMNSLVQYKKLDEQCQKEVRDFIKFKYSQQEKE